MTPLDKHGKVLSVGDPVVIHNWQGNGMLQLVGMVQSIHHDGNAATLAYPMVVNASPNTAPAAWLGNKVFPVSRLLKIKPGYQGPDKPKPKPLSLDDLPLLWQIG